MPQNRDLNYQNFKAIIFDVDGTLYDQAKMRRFMVLELAKYYFLRLWKIFDLLIILKFRFERERLSKAGAHNLECQQYKTVAEKLSVSEQRVREVIEEWIYKRPLKYFKFCVFGSLGVFLKNLVSKNIQIIFLSDYPAEEKLGALGIAYDPNRVFYTASPEIDALKPNPKALRVIFAMLGLGADNVLIIGDREDKEGLMAKKVGAAYLLVGNESDNFYRGLAKKFE